MIDWVELRIKKPKLNHTVAVYTPCGYKFFGHLEEYMGGLIWVGDNARYHSTEDTWWAECEGPLVLGTR